MPSTNGTIESSNHVVLADRRRLLERPEAVGEDRDARRDRAHVAEERLGVHVERAAVAAAPSPSSTQLGAALAGDHEQRRRARDDEEPRRDRHADRDTAGDRAQHEPGRDGREVEHRLRASATCCTRSSARGSRRRTSASCQPGERTTARSPATTEHDAADDRGLHRDLAGRDRPEPLGRVAAIGLDVERVVEVVGAARGEAEAHERDRGVWNSAVALGEHAGRARRRDDEHVLDPLLRPRQAQRARDARCSGATSCGAAARGDGARASASVTVTSDRPAAAQISSGSCSMSSTSSLEASAGTPPRMRSSEARCPSRPRRRPRADDEAELRRAGRGRAAARTPTTNADDADDPRRSPPPRSCAARSAPCASVSARMNSAAAEREQTEVAVAER